MSTIRNLIALGGLALLLAACGAQQPTAAPGVAALAFDGKAVSAAFSDSCGGCHGAQRQGATGPALIPGRLTEDDDYYFDIIQNGKPGTAMPAWGRAGMSDEEIWTLVGLMRSEPSATWSAETQRPATSRLSTRSGTSAR